MLGLAFNKAQGQTIPKVGVYLLKPMFSHDQLYVALSRAAGRSNTEILVVTPNNKEDKKNLTITSGTCTKNVACKEVLTT